MSRSAPDSSGDLRYALKTPYRDGTTHIVLEPWNFIARLLGASTTRAAMVHLHEVVEGEGVAKMRAIEAVPIPAGAKATLAPQGTHIMLMGLGAPLVAGPSFPLTLRFGESAAQIVTATVRTATDDGGAHAHH